MIFAQGIYQMDSVTIPAGETWEAAGRVIITRADGRPPTVDIQPGATARNLWFVGTRETDPNTQSVCFLHDDATADNCAFAGYYGGFAVGTHVRGKLVNNLFVRCGTGDKSHPVYVSNWNGVGDGCTIDNNVFVGCQGYSVHLWNDNYNGTNYNTVTNNFIAQAYRGIVSRGRDNTITGNIIWSNYSTHSYLADGAALRWTKNLYGAGVHPLMLNQADADAVIRKNGFVGMTPSFGSVPQNFASGDMKTLLGFTPNRIDTTVQLLIDAFAQPPDALLANPDLAPAINRLRTCVWNWNN